MAENKKSFVLYTDLIHTVDQLPNETAGALLKHILEYVNDLNPETDNLLVKIAFEPIKQQLKRDLKKYEKYREKQRLNGAKGGRPRKTQKTQPFIKKPKKADSVNVNVSVNDNDNIIHIEDAFDFLKNEEPEKIEIFEMQNKKSFQGDYETFKENFNFKVIEEDMEWNPKKLLARLWRMNSNWDKTPKKEKEKYPAKKEKVDSAILLHKRIGI